MIFWPITKKSTFLHKHAKKQLFDGLLYFSGRCGSCWSFSATGALEGQHFQETGKLVSLSEQNLIDCSVPEGNHGCKGGLPQYAFEYVLDEGGIDTEKTYPYEGRDHQKCRYKAKNSGAHDAGYVEIESGNDEKLLMAVATVGPISVGIDASLATFMHYQHGG